MKPEVFFHSWVTELAAFLTFANRVLATQPNLATQEFTWAKLGHSRMEYALSGSALWPSQCLVLGLVLLLMCEVICHTHTVKPNYAGLEETQAGIKIAGRNINNLRYADDTTFMAESEEELKSLLMKVKEESENVGLKLNIQKMKIMASGSITSIQTETDFIFGGSKITADGDCSQEIKR